MINKIITKRNTLSLLIIMLCNICFSQIYFKVINEGRPATYRAPIVTVSTLKSTESNSISGVPAYIWSYGCTPTAVGMLIAYYNRLGYCNLNYDPYTYAPMNNSEWGISSENQGEDPLIATRKGLNGKTTRGHVNDYYIAFNSSQRDPFLTNGWSEHTPKECIADYLGTSQYNNSALQSDGTVIRPNDGFTITINPQMDGSKFSGLDNPVTCEIGIKKYIESKGYVVSDCYTQVFNGYLDASGTIASNGFTFQDFKNEIDNNYPVLIQLEGHTMLGYGYNSRTTRINVHDTFDYSDHEMDWGGTYFDGTDYLPMTGVTIVHISSPPQGPPVCINCNYPGAPNAPTLNNAAFNCNNNSITLSWTPSSTGSTPDYYAIYRCPSTETMTDNDKIANTAQLSYSDFNFTANANISYTYAVAAINNTGEGLNSNQKTVSLAPCTNTNIFNTNITTSATYKCSNIHINNTSVNNNSTATFNYSNSVTIYSDFNVDLGSTLIIQKQ